MSRKNHKQIFDDYCHVKMFTIMTFKLYLSVRVLL